MPFNLGVLKNFAIFTGKQLCWSLLLVKLQPFRCLTRVWACKYCEIFKNTYFKEHLWTAASVPYLDLKRAHLQNISICMKKICLVWRVIFYSLQVTRFSSPAQSLVTLTRTLVPRCKNSPLLVAKFGCYALLITKLQSFKTRVLAHAHLYGNVFSSK